MKYSGGFASFALAAVPLTGAELRPYRILRDGAHPPKGASWAAVEGAPDGSVYGGVVRRQMLEKHIKTSAAAK